VWRLFQPGGGDEQATARPGPKTADTDGDQAIVCARCRLRITSAGARIDVAGSHVHECVNPHGFRWRIGCFAVAEGLVVVSEPEAHWSWFPGYTWEIENCAGCRELLGWRYRSGDSSFHGLILPHLVDG